MASFIKLDSAQTGPFTANFRNVDFDIPAGNYDFSQSYVNIMTEIIDSNLAQFGEVYLANSVANNQSMWSSSLVENVSLDTELGGNVENIRKVNVLTQNLKEYTLSIADKKALASQDIYGCVDSRAYISTSICRRINRQGSLGSVAIESPIRIDLKDILLGVGGLSSMPLDRLGKGRLHLELQPSLVTPIYFEYSNYQTVFADPFAVGATQVLVSNRVNTPAAAGDNPNVNGDMFFPLYVGQGISIPDAGTPAPPGAPVAQPLITSITSISFNATTAKWVVGIANPIVVASGAGVFKPVQPANPGNLTLSVSFNRVELVLKQLPNKSSAGQLQYRTFTTEEASGFPVGSYEKLFYLEPNAVNLMVMSPGASRDSILSTRRYSSYRFRLDNEDLITRDINITNNGDPLHFDRLKSTLVNAGYNLNNLQRKNYKTNEYDSAGAAQPDTSIETIMSPLPLTQNEKQFQLNLVAAAAVDRLILYKQVVRAI